MMETSEKSYRLALLQMRMVDGQPEANQDKALQMIRQAAEAGAQVALLPEALPLGWTHSSARNLAESIPDGTFVSALQESARAHGLYVCSGVIEKADETVHNSAVLIGPDGDILIHHRKLNELSLAHSLYAPGDRLAVAQTPLGRMGVMICADGFAKDQVISRSLGWMGSDIILSPCAWAVPADHDPAAEPYGSFWLEQYQPVAKEFRMWIAAASYVGPVTEGPWEGRRCIGCSLVVDPEGKEVVKGPYGMDAEDLILTTITPVAHRKRPVTDR